MHLHKPNRPSTQPPPMHTCTDDHTHSQPSFPVMPSPMLTPAVLAQICPTLYLAKCVCLFACRRVQCVGDAWMCVIWIEGRTEGRHGSWIFLNLKQNMNYRGANPFQMQFPGFPTPLIQTHFACTHTLSKIHNPDLWHKSTPLGSSFGGTYSCFIFNSS